jgi:hypothetical protein
LAATSFLGKVARKIALEGGFFSFFGRLAACPKQKTGNKKGRKQETIHFIGF